MLWNNKVTLRRISLELTFEIINSLVYSEAINEEEHHVITTKYVNFKKC